MTDEFDYAEDFGDFDGWDYLDVPEPEYDEFRPPFEFRDERGPLTRAAALGDWDQEACAVATRLKRQREWDAGTLAMVAKIGCGFGPLSRADLALLRDLDRWYDCNEDARDEEEPDILERWRPDDPECPPLLLRECATMREPDGRLVWLDEPTCLLGWLGTLARTLHERDPNFWLRLRRLGPTPANVTAANETLAPAKASAEQRGHVAPTLLWMRQRRDSARRRGSSRSARPGPTRRRGSRRTLTRTGGGGDPPDGGEGDESPARAWLTVVLITAVAAVTLAGGPMAGNATVASPLEVMNPADRCAQLVGSLRAGGLSEALIAEAVRLYDLRMRNEGASTWGYDDIDAYFLGLLEEPEGGEVRRSPEVTRHLLKRLEKHRGKLAGSIDALPADERVEAAYDFAFVIVRLDAMISGAREELRRVPRQPHQRHRGDLRRTRPRSRARRSPSRRRQRRSSAAGPDPGDPDPGGEPAEAAGADIGNGRGGRA